MVLLFCLTFSSSGEESLRSRIEELLEQGGIQAATALVSDWKRQRPDGLSPEELLFCEGCIHLTSRRYDEAIGIFGKLVDAFDMNPTFLLVEANAKLGRALALSGNMQAAIAAWSAEVKANMALKRRSIMEEKKPVYFLNRLDLDGELESWLAIHGREASSLESLDNLLQLNTFILNLAETFTGMRKLAAETSELLLGKGRTDDAIALALRAITTGEDRCFLQNARLPENQSQLDWVAKPLSSDEIAPVFYALCNAVSKKYPYERLPKNTMTELANEYCHALSASWKPDGGSGKVLEELATRQELTFWRNLMMSEAALAYFREGQYALGLTCLAAHETETAFSQRIAYLEGIILMATGQFAKAALKLELASQDNQINHDAVLISKARLLCCEAYEANDDKLKAIACLEKLLASSNVLSHRREADIALKRLKVEMDIPLHSNAKDILSPLADNRATHGNWPMNFGRECHLLAAQQGKTDTFGYATPLSRMPCRIRTNNAMEKRRLWITQVKSPDPASLWNPYERCRTSANTDDYGEQYPIGQGPDLILECGLPAGQHILSLYFVNDYNYYENNRSYTITVLENGQLLGNFPLRWFGGGVYKRFAVDGPRDLEIRIQRNASMNVLLSGVFLDKRSGLFTKDEKQKMQSILQKDIKDFKREEALSVRDYNRYEELVLDWACSSLGKDIIIDGILKAEAWALAGQNDLSRACMEQFIEVLRKGKDWQMADNMLYLLCRLDYWEIGGENELWNGMQPHPLGDLWNAWLQIRRNRVITEGFPVNVHQREMFRLLQENDWRVVSSARKEMWKDCSERRKEDSASWAYYAIAKQCHREHNIQERDVFLTRALSALTVRPEPRLHLRILETRLQWQCLENDEPENVLATYRQLESFSTVSPHRRSTWSLLVSTLYSNRGEYKHAMAWLEKAEKYGEANSHDSLLRQSLRQKMEAAGNGN